MINLVNLAQLFLKFSLTKIIPISKPGKPVDHIDSFRPLNNLSALEKLLEEWIKRCLVGWLEGNYIIKGDHHGGRYGFSTLTAIAKIKQQINKNLQNKNFGVLLCTDLSAAFDCISHKTLLGKMEHYGIRGEELKLFNSYLSKRKQMVEVDTFRSKILDCLDLSCIQGNKLAGTLYNLYCNEVTLLYRILQCPKLLEALLTTGPSNPLNFYGMSSHENTSRVLSDRGLDGYNHPATHGLLGTNNTPPSDTRLHIRHPWPAHREVRALSMFKLLCKKKYSSRADHSNKINFYGCHGCFDKECDLPSSDAPRRLNNNH